MEKKILSKFYLDKEKDIIVTIYRKNEEEVMKNINLIKDLQAVAILLEVKK